MRTGSAVCIAVAVVSIGLASFRSAGAQDAAPADELRLAHERAVYALVRIRGRRAGHGSGWLIAQRGRPLVITNRHVVEHVEGSRIHVDFYGGASGSPVTGIAHLLARPSRTIDLAVLQLDADPPPTARGLEVEPGDVVRGQRVVLAGHPGALPFQTTEGVITGAMPEVPEISATCGAGRNCLVVDAASMGGSSGGPAVNRAGRVIAMLWGGPRASVATPSGRLPAWIENPAFAFLIHIRTIEDELRRIAESRPR